MDEQDNVQAIVEITIHANRRDYLDYYWIWYRRENKAHQLVFVLLALLTVIAYILAANYSLSWRFAVAESAMVFWPLALISLALRPRLAYRRRRETYEAAVSYVFFEDHLCMRKSDQGADTQVTAQYSRYPWGGESLTAFYLKTPDRNYVSLPKHCLTKEQADTLRDLFVRKFGENFKTKM